MTKTKSTKRALFSSALALLLCCTMLLGTTFAWFTDSVSTTNNIIKSGNLDVELEYLNGSNWEKVTETTNVFGDSLWEPGHTEVVYLKISNLGTLALKYQLGINIVNEVESINVNDQAFRLSNYIEFAAIDDVSTPYADRAAARAAVTESAVLSTGHTKSGSIEVGGDAQYVALVVYMPETVGNVANYRAGEVAPEIDLGINLVATQYTSESDSFNNQYDAGAKFDGVPVARVTVLSDMPTVTTTNDKTFTLDTAYVFNTTETYDQAQLNAHRYWHADFVASFDRDVDDAAIGLAGQYDYYSENWLAFELDGFGDIAANTPVRMLDFADISMNYEDLCLFVKEFSCGAFAVDPAAMAGTTMTVELRLYETTKDPNATSGSANEETGKYITIGAYSHTFAAKAVNQTELNTAIAEGADTIKLAAGNYTIPDSASGKTLTIVGNGNTVIDITDGNQVFNTGLTYVTGSTITFKGLTIQSEQRSAGYEHGFAHANKVSFDNCVINGTLGLNSDSEFSGCTFNVEGDYYNVWTWGAPNATFNNCTFNSDGKALLLYGQVNTKLTVNGCTFNDKGGLTDKKAAIEIANDYDKSYTLIVNNTTVNGYEINDKGVNTGTTLWANKNSMDKDHLNVVVDNVDVY